MKWSALLLCPVIAVAFNACEKHDVSDLKKIEESAGIVPAIGGCLSGRIGFNDHGQAPFFALATAARDCIWFAV